MSSISKRIVGSNDAVMFDIDETLIHESGSPIYEMIQLFFACQSLGYKTIIITARPNTIMNRHYTTIQLLSLGIVPSEVHYCAAENKTACKRRTGYRYVLSVGDQLTDLGYSDAIIKLPDASDRKIYTSKLG